MTTVIDMAQGLRPRGEAQSPFFEGTKLQWAWDSTSLNALKKCPRYYKYTILEGWAPKATSHHLTFGIHFHKGLEIYDKLRAQGQDPEEALDGVVALLLESTWERDADGSGRPWNTGDSYKNRWTLLRSVIWYLETYGEDDPARTLIRADGSPAVELSFSFDPGIALDGQPLLLAGHLDRVVEFPIDSGDLFVMDRKTTKTALTPYYFRGFNPDGQMTQYTIAGQVILQTQIKGVIIDGAQILVNSTDFGRSPTMRSQGQLDEYITMIEDWAKTAQLYHDKNHYPMNEQSCNNYGGCSFRDDVCSKDPKVRDMFLNTHFEKRFWNPLEKR